MHVTDEDYHCVKCIMALTVLLKNMRTLKFKSQLTFAYFAAVSHLNGPLRKQNFTKRIQKVMVWDLWLMDFDPFCVFQGSLLVILINCGSKKHSCLKGGFWTLDWVRMFMKSVVMGCLMNNHCFINKQDTLIPCKYWL